MLRSRRRATRRQRMPANDHVGWHEIAVEISEESQFFRSNGRLLDYRIDVCVMIIMMFTRQL